MGRVNITYHITTINNNLQSCLTQQPHGLLPIKQEGQRLQRRITTTIRHQGKLNEQVTKWHEPVYITKVDRRPRATKEFYAGVHAQGAECHATRLRQRSSQNENIQTTLIPIRTCHYSMDMREV